MLLRITFLAEYLKDTTFFSRKYIIITLLCVASYLSFYELLYAAEGYPTIGNRHIKEVKHDIAKTPSELWSMDDGAIAKFCATALKEKQYENDAAEKEIERLLHLLTTTLSKEKAVILRRQQVAWQTKRAKRADALFSAEEDLSEEEQADIQATCYPQKSLNRASYDLVTAKNRIKELENIQQNLAGGKKEETPTTCDTDKAFTGVYGTLWLPVGYALLEISYHESNAPPDRPFKLVLQSEAILPLKSEVSCEINLFGSYKDGHLEFIDRDHSEFLIYVQWNEDKSGLIIRALDFNDSAKEYAGDAGRYYCGQGIDFVGSYYDLNVR